MNRKKTSTKKQSGVVPFRIIDGEVEILLVSSRAGKKWTVPKGGIKKILSASESAVEEAYEEAGIRGRLIRPNLGRFEYRKGGRRHRVKMFLFAVTEMASNWPESDFRERRWIPLSKAQHVAKFKGLSKIFETAGQRIASL